ncbi:MAG: sulfotransferase [Caldilineaceae bacterium]|nr:sulfotransferase [Caldilineaceae bacterium]
MMMRMLEAGGLPPLTDNLRTADLDNPQGYYEFERVKQLSRGDTAWLATAQGHAVKVISALLPHLPDSYSYNVIFVERHMNEILASQRKMLAHRQEDTNAVDDTQMTALFQKHLQETQQWLAQQPNFRVLYIHYSDLLRDPATHAAQVNQFLGGKLAVTPMVSMIDPTLYRNRA